MDQPNHESDELEIRDMVKGLRAALEGETARGASGPGAAGLTRDAQGCRFRAW